MRPPPRLAVTLFAAGLLGALPLAAAPSVARADPPPPVPGPQRPIGDLPPLPEPPPERRRPPAPSVEPRPPARTEAPAAASPLPEAVEGAFRPGARGEKAGGRALARLGGGELRLEKLSVTPGRDLELWLVTVDRIGERDDLGDAKHVSLGRLKKAEGDQTYRLPPEIDLRVYRTAVVWSRRERSARAFALLVPQAIQRPVKGKTNRNR